jgi:16S rRNA processing protein RimM
MSDLVLIGRIAKIHGLRGEVIIALAGGDPARFVPGARLFLDEAGAEPVVLARIAVRERSIAARFEGISDRTAAEPLLGRMLYQKAEDLPPLPEGEYYHFQLLGLAVTRSDGRPLGKVEAVFEIAGTDLFEVVGDEGTWLVPGRKEFVAWVDMEKREMRLTDREDLLLSQKDVTRRSSASPS